MTITPTEATPWAEQADAVAASLGSSTDGLATADVDLRLEIVVFDRAARRVFDDFVAAAEFPAALARAQAAGKLAAGNGSALEAGLALCWPRRRAWAGRSRRSIRRSPGCPGAFR